MILLDVLLAVVLSLGIVLAGDSLINGQMESVRQMERLATYATDVPAVRSIITRAAEHADKVVLYTNAAAARTGGDAGRSNSGTAIRLWYTTGPMVPAGQSAWGAMLEFRSSGIYYVNIDGSGNAVGEWLVAQTTGSFTLVDGVLSAWCYARDSGGSRTATTSIFNDVVSCAAN